MSDIAENNIGDQGRLQESATNAREAVGELAGEAGRYARQRVRDAKESASAMLETVKSKAGDYNENVVGYIRENPWKALAIAGGIGLLAGMLLRRR